MTEEKKLVEDRKRKRKSFSIRDLILNEEKPTVSSKPAKKAKYHRALESAEIHLESARLWRQFSELGTEMIVTRSGRRMFPGLQLRLRGLVADAQYSLIVDFEPVDRKRYRYQFHKSRWIVAGPGDPELPPRLHHHPDSPATGAYWMKQPVSFDKLKITNNQLDANGFIILNSMHRYRPRIRLSVVEDQHENDNSKGQGPSSLSRDNCRVFRFAETVFMAVTAYQNQSVTKLKISSNPFAKGFRDNDPDEWALYALQSGSFSAYLPAVGRDSNSVLIGSD